MRGTRVRIGLSSLLRYPVRTANPPYCIFFEYLNKTSKCSLLQLCSKFGRNASKIWSFCLIRIFIPTISLVPPPVHITGSPVAGLKPPVHITGSPVAGLKPPCPHNRQSCGRTETSCPHNWQSFGRTENKWLSS